MQALTIRRPDDFHLHLRDGALLRAVAGASAARFARALVMPNLQPPVRSCAEAAAYRERILAALPAHTDFQPLAALFLHEDMTPAEVRKAAAAEHVLGVKYYPAGATTHTRAGVRRAERVYPVLEILQEVDLPLLVHAEDPAPEVDVFDREEVFLERTLEPLVRHFPALRVVLEHVSTRAGVEFVRSGAERLAATITAHHLLLERNSLFLGGRLRPHHYCLPPLKRATDRAALREAATGDCPRFFLGTDSAPHPRSAKESAAGCAGIYSACAALELYAQVFEQGGRLEQLQAFASERGADFYRLPRNQGNITLERVSWTLPSALPLEEGGELIPLAAGANCPWRIRKPS